jgi:hypothetical protein
MLAAKPTAVIGSMPRGELEPYWGVGSSVAKSARENKELC